MKKSATIITTFNGEKWIKNCLHSVFHSHFPTTIFVIDNASLLRHEPEPRASEGGSFFLTNEYYTCF